MDVSQTYFADYTDNFAIYTNINSLYYVPESNKCCMSIISPQKRKKGEILMKILIWEK